MACIRRAGLPPIRTRIKGLEDSGISPRPRDLLVCPETNDAPLCSNRQRMDSYLFLLNLLILDFWTMLCVFLR